MEPQEQAVDPTTVTVSISPDDALISADELFGYLDKRLGLAADQGDTNG